MYSSKLRTWMLLLIFKKGASHIVNWEQSAGIAHSTERAACSNLSSCPHPLPLSECLQKETVNRVQSLLV